MSDYKIRGWPPTAEFVVDSVTRIETLEARIEALEAALREIMEETSFKGAPFKELQPVDDIWSIARAALAPEQDK